MIRALVLLLLLAGCGGPLSLLTGGGPNVAANVQAGQENRQAAVAVEGSRQSISRVSGDVRQETSAVRADTITTFNEGVPPIYWIAWAMSLFIALWLDSPKRWPGQIMAAFRRN